MCFFGLPKKSVKVPVTSEQCKISRDVQGRAPNRYLSVGAKLT